MKFCAFILLMAALLPLRSADGASGSPAPASVAMDPVAADVIVRYVKAIQAQEAKAQAVSMDVDMDADLPKLKKHGRFHAFRFITRVGQIFYNRPRFEGDNTIKKEVIGRYLQAEKEAKSDYGAAVSVTPANYKFKYNGTTPYNDRTAYVFEVSPKQKRLGLYKGEIWIDKDTDLPLRQWGELVRSPSMFLKSVYFVRDYSIYDGVSVPRRLISDVGTRLFGKAHLTIWYENVKLGDNVKAATLAGPTETAQADGGHN